MVLVQQIKRDRLRQRVKQPLAENALRTVSALVRDFALGEEFLVRLQAAARELPATPWEPIGLQPKPGYRVPPFVLVSAEQYRISLAIVERLPNPYLAFARSPQELLLAAALHKADPELDPKLLRRWDFATLCRRRQAYWELAALSARRDRGPIAPGVMDSGAGPAGAGGRDHALQERIERLRAFIARVEGNTDGA